MSEEVSVACGGGTHDEIPQKSTGRRAERCVEATCINYSRSNPHLIHFLQIETHALLYPCYPSGVELNSPPVATSIHL